MAAGTIDPRACVEQGKSLGKAVGAETVLNAFLAGKERIAAIHTARSGSVLLQFFTQPDVDEHGSWMATFGHVGQQTDLFLDQAVCSDHIAPAQASDFANSQARPVGQQHHAAVAGGVLACVNVCQQSFKFCCAKGSGLGHMRCPSNSVIAVVALCFHIFIWTTGNPPNWRDIGAIDLKKEADCG